MEKCTTRATFADFTQNSPRSPKVFWPLKGIDSTGTWNTLWLASCFPRGDGARKSFDAPIALHYACITRAGYSKRDVCFPRLGVWKNYPQTSVAVRDFVPPLMALSYKCNICYWNIFGKCAEFCKLSFISLESPCVYLSKEISFITIWYFWVKMWPCGYVPKWNIFSAYNSS